MADKSSEEDVQTGNATLEATRNIARANWRHEQDA